jgi:hypothetical protein
MQAPRLQGLPEKVGQPLLQKHAQSKQAARAEPSAKKLRRLQQPYVRE